MKVPHCLIKKKKVMDGNGSDFGWIRFLAPSPLDLDFFFFKVVRSKADNIHMVGPSRYFCVKARRARQRPKWSGVVPVTLYFGYRGIFVI